MRINFIEILRKKVEIPIIQRDYAQGRTDKKTSKIRNEFLDVLFDFIARKQHKPGLEIELDFIYGFNQQDSNNETTFIPIDGQQRLTTLWLIYWFVSVKEEGIPDCETDFLSNFVYETRHSTTQFIRNLVSFEPKFNYPYIDQEITDQPWYFETWDYDPSIQAMLVVLKDIEQRYNDLNTGSLWSTIIDSPFYLYKLDMDKVGLRDDLYIKMNSRGKPITEFEYFKAGFTELISDPGQKKRFEESIDGKWMDTIWQIIRDSGYIEEGQDIASVVDNALMNLIDFITSVISLKSKDSSGSRYVDMVDTPELLRTIYKDTKNQNYLFDTLDAICKQKEGNPDFWSSIFYYEKDDFTSEKTRLFFFHKETNLLKRCLFHYSGTRGLSYAEQILLFACLTHLKSSTASFSNRIRILRNLVVNSENELREDVLGDALNEAENYISNGDLDELKKYNTDQIKEEKSKAGFISQTLGSKIVLQELEDSDIFRGSISLFNFDVDFNSRAKKFLELFDENGFVADFSTKSRLLLSFGDYSQEYRALVNLMAPNMGVIRRFLTAPGYNKVDFSKNTKPVILKCLDYFIKNTDHSIEKTIEDAISQYDDKPKNWRYYFLKYPSFNSGCNQGYYSIGKGENCRVWKMKERKYNGAHWDPFFYEIVKSNKIKNVSLANRGAPLIFSDHHGTISISSTTSGFIIEYDKDNSALSLLFEELYKQVIIECDGLLNIPEDVDKVEFLERVLTSLENKNSTALY